MFRNENVNTNVDYNYKINHDLICKNCGKTLGKHYDWYCSVEEKKSIELTEFRNKVYQITMDALNNNVSVTIISYVHSSNKTFIHSSNKTFIHGLTFANGNLRT
jgi:hypothetical protein